MPTQENPIDHRDQIAVTGLGLVTRIGVPEEERATAQRLEADLTLWPAAPLSGLGDDLPGTINYAEVAEACRALAAERPRQLIETLAEELVMLLLTRWPLAAARVTLRKFILPDTRSVSVTLTRTRPEAVA